MNFRSKFIYLNLFLLLFLLPVACKKDSEKGVEPDRVTEPTNNVTISSSDLSPGQTVVLTFDAGVTLKDSVNVNLNGTVMPMFKTNQDQYAGIIPVIPEGTYQLKIKSVNFKEPITFKVAPYAVITEPKVIIDNYRTEIESLITQLRTQAKADGNELNTGFIDQLKTQFEQSLTTASAAEKIELAYLLRAHNFKAEDLAFSAVSPATKTVTMSVASSNDVAGRLENSGKKFVGNMILVVAAFNTSSVALNSFMIAPNVVSGLIATASTLTMVCFINQAVTNAEKIGNLPGVVSEITSIYTSAKESTLNFKKDADLSLFNMGEFRTLSIADIGSSSIFLKSVAVSNQLLTDIDSKVGSLMNSAAKYFPKLGTYTVSASKIKAVPVKNAEEIPYNKFSIGNISDPGIKLTVVSDELQMKVKATSATVADDKSFTFDIIYTHEGTGVTVKKTISAVYAGTVNPAKIELSSGNNQAMEAGKKLANPLKVKITDADGNVVQNVKVEWKVKSGGGTLTLAESVTDVLGIAQTEWTPGSTGTQEVEASAKKKDGTLVAGSPVLFATSAAGIVGRWHLDLMVETGYENGVSDGSQNIDNTYGPEEITEFRTNGTMTGNEPLNGTKRTSTYKITGSTLTLSNTASGAAEIWEIKKLTAQQMILVTKGEERISNGVVYYETYETTFSRLTDQ